MIDQTDLARFNKATKLLDKNKPEQALKLFRRQEIFCKEYYLNLGNCYRLLDKDDKALECYLESADQRTPWASGGYKPYPLALCNIGLLHYCYGDDKTAIKYYQSALSEDPLHFDAIWNYSSALLRQCSSGESQEWRAAWQMYSYRFKKTNPTRIAQHIPLWDGISKHKSICVLSEQGQGDKIQFARYLPLLKELFPEVRVQCPKTMNWLFKEYNPSEEAIGEVAIPFCQLAERFGLVSGNWIDYQLEPEAKKIALCFSGSPTHANNRFRSIPSRWSEYLVKGLVARGYTPVHIGPEDPKMPQLGWVPSQTWETTVKELAKCSLLISCDTSIVHLAGSMAVPGLVIQPFKETDWRWGSHGTGNVWYDSIKVIRNPQDWGKAIGETLTYV